MEENSHLAPGVEGAESPSPERARLMGDFDAAEATERVRIRQESDPPCMPLRGDDDPTAFDRRHGDRREWSDEARSAYLEGFVASLGKQRVAYIEGWDCVVDCEEWKHDRIVPGLVNHASGDPNEGWTRS